MDKQKATFEKVVEFHMHASGQFSARLAYVKDHPKLGRAIHDKTLPP